MQSGSNNMDSSSNLQQGITSDDKYEYGLQKRVKKRKYNDFFAEKKMQNNTNPIDEEEEKEVH